MKALSVFLFFCLQIVRAQAPQTVPDLPDETVICTFDDGVKFTMREFKQVWGSLPSDMQQMALNNRRDWLNQYSLMRKLTKMAEENKLDQESPYKEALAFARLQILSQAQMMEVNKGGAVSQGEILKEYDSKKESTYKQARIKAIYISFSDSAGKGKKALSEADAKAKAAKLAAAARSGADFGKLARENSDDETSKAKDGDFSTFRATDNIPDAIRAAVFVLKPGEVSDPVGQPNGFYVFRCEEVTYRPFSQVRDELFTEIKTRRFHETMNKLDGDAKVKSINPAFLGTPPNSPPK
jgi:parvulin-like peptidyl-prolyl isomerase